MLAGFRSIEEAHESIDWRTVFRVAGMLPSGMAMHETDTAQFLADVMLDALGGYGPIALVARRVSWRCSSPKPCLGRLP
jgi:di/tricarboxylate transporter